MQSPAKMAARPAGPLMPIGGRELVRIGERFYSGELQVTFALTAMAAVVAAVLATLGAIGSGSWHSVVLALVVVASGVVASSYTDGIYVAMRARPWLCLVPAILMGLLIALDGSLDSPLYMPAQAMPVIAAIAGSIWLGVAASGVMGALYVVGVVAAGSATTTEDQFLAAGSVLGFVAWAALFGFFAHALAAFVMRLPSLADVSPEPRPARRVRVDFRVGDPPERDPPESAAAGHLRLTGRQLEVAHLIAAGMTSEQIARELGISASTVDRHAAAAARRLGVTGRSQLAAAVASGSCAANPEPEQ